MDPPSYGRGPSGEVWKLEESIDPLIRLTTGVLSDEPLFFLVNSYTTGLSPSCMGYLLHLAMSRYNGRVDSDEIGLPVSSTGAVSAVRFEFALVGEKCIKFEKERGAGERKPFSKGFLSPAKRR